VVISYFGYRFYSVACLVAYSYSAYYAEGQLIILDLNMFQDRDTLLFSKAAAFDLFADPYHPNQSQHTTMHWLNLGRDFKQWTFDQKQQQFRQRFFNLAFVAFVLYFFNLAFVRARPATNVPNFGNADRYTKLRATTLNSPHVLQIMIFSNEYYWGIAAERGHALVVFFWWWGWQQ